MEVVRIPLVLAANARSSIQIARRCVRLTCCWLRPHCISTIAGGRLSELRVRIEQMPASPMLRKNPNGIRTHCSSSSSSSSSNSNSKGSSGTNREILVQHLLLKEDQLQLLTELQQRLATEDVDLSDLAVEFSTCPSKSKGGMLGWVSKGQMFPEFEEAAFNAPLNKIVRCKTKFGWHLVQILSEREAGFLLEVEPEELSRKLEEENFSNNAQLIDVREPKEIAIAKIEGFQPFPLSQFGEWGPTITDKLDPAKDTYVLCHHGVRSLQAAHWLKSQGFKRVHNISGGIHAYSTRVDDTVPVY